VPLKTVQIVQHKQRLDSPFSIAIDLAGDNEVLAHCAKYMFVLVSGLIEQSVRVLVLEYAKAKASPEIEHFVGRKVRSFQNAKMSKILTLLEEFSGDLRMQIETLTTDELKDAVDSVVNNRHQIAHGQSSGITFARIKDYYGRVVTVVENLESVLVR